MSETKCPVLRVYNRNVESVCSEESITNALAITGITTAWYALPDFVRSRPLRALLKLGIFAGGSVLGCRVTPQEAPEIDPEQIVEAWKKCPVSQWPVPLQGLVLALAAGGGLWGSLWLERKIFRRGEARRDRGVKLPHTRQGLFLGLITGALVFSLDLVEVVESTTDLD